MIWKQYLAQQSRKPSGLFGRLLMGRYLDRANANSNALVYDTLAPRPVDQVLEIGFGGADLLLRIAGNLDGGSIEGLELSAEMLASARRRARKLGLDHRTGFHLGGVDALPFDDASFDLACSAHTIYFWPDLDHGLAEIARVLKPGGALVLGFSSDTALRQEGWVERGFQAYSSEQLIEACRARGFTLDRLNLIERKPGGNVCAYRGIKA